MADAHDSKSCSFGIVGSIPTFGTKSPRGLFRYKLRIMVSTDKDRKTSLRWLGTAGIQIKSHNEILLIDPFLSRPPFKFLFAGRVHPDQDQISKHILHADHVLISHAHYDHLMDVPFIALHTRAQIYGSPNTCQILQIHHVPKDQIHPVHEGDEFKASNFLIEVIPAKHPIVPGYTAGRLKSKLEPPLSLRDYRMDNYFSFLITTDELRILVWSSISTHYAQPADVLFVRAVASPDWYAELLAIVKPRLVIPTHWDDIFQPLSKPAQPFLAPPLFSIQPIKRINLDDFRKTIQFIVPNCNVLIPERFRQYDLLGDKIIY